MDYVGIDPAVGLECSHCHHISRIPYSRLLRLVTETERAVAHFTHPVPGSADSLQGGGYRSR